MWNPRAANWPERSINLGWSGSALYQWSVWQRAAHHTEDKWFFKTPWAFLENQCRCALGALWPLGLSQLPALKHTSLKNHRISWHTCHASQSVSIEQVVVAGCRWASRQWAQMLQVAILLRNLGQEAILQNWMCVNSCFELQLLFSSQPQIKFYISVWSTSTHNFISANKCRASVMKSLYHLKSPTDCATPAHGSFNADFTGWGCTCTFAHDVESSRQRATHYLGCNHL